MNNKNSIKKICSICGNEYEGFGNDAFPIKQGRCCEGCNIVVVIPARVKMMASTKKAI